MGSHEERPRSPGPPHSSGPGGAGTGSGLRRTRFRLRGMAAGRSGIGELSLGPGSGAQPPAPGRGGELTGRPLAEERKAAILASFQEAEQEWTRFRDAECKAQSAANTISARPVQELYHRCLSKMTRERMRETRAAEPGAVPDAPPFDTAYGPAITAERAAQAVAAAIAAAQRPPRSWKLSISVVDPNGDPVYFYRMDQAPIASVAVAQERARAAARHRR